MTLPSTTLPTISKTYLRHSVVAQEGTKTNNTGFIVTIVVLCLILFGIISYYMYKQKGKNKRQSIVPDENEKIQKSIEKKQIIKRVREEMKKANITTNRSIPTHKADLETAMKTSEVKPSMATVAKLKTEFPKRPKRPSELQRMTIDDWNKLNHKVKGTQADRKVIQMMQRNKVVKNSNFK